jgi:hypothetical protein
MSQAKLPSIVLISINGQTLPALVLSARFGEVSHLGKNGEPLLTLAFVKQALPSQPHKKPTVFQAAVAVPEIQIEHDVVHASHEFDEEFKRKHGSTPAQIAAQRGHAEWSEYAVEAIDTPVKEVALEEKAEAAEKASA